MRAGYEKQCAFHDAVRQGRRHAIGGDQVAELAVKAVSWGAALHLPDGVANVFVRVSLVVDEVAVTHEERTVAKISASPAGGSLVTATVPGIRRKLKRGKVVMIRDGVHRVEFFSSA